MTLQLGRKPKIPDARDFLLAAHTLPTVKEPFGHGNTYADWSMLGNGPDPTAPGAAAQGCGDCVWASANHETMVALTDAGITPASVAALFSGTTAVEDYAEFTGYDYKTGEGDDGTEIREALKQRQKTGIRDLKRHRHKIGVYASVDYANEQELLVAAKFFEALPLGCTVTQGNMDAFNAAEESGETCVWDADSTAQLGGHCIPIVGRPDGEHWAAVSWGKRVLLTEGFLAKNVEEVWAYLTPERISSVTGKNYEGASEAVLAEYLNAVAA
jgi:hypothetical protein